MVGTGDHVVSWNQDWFEMVNCTLILDDIPTASQGNIALEGVHDGIIENCQVFGGIVGVNLSSGAGVAIRGCVFDSQESVAIYPSVGARVSVVDSKFRHLRAAMYSAVLDNHVTLSHCVVEDVVDCSFKIGYTGSFTVNECDLARGGEGVVVIPERFDPCPAETLDMTNNYWGTDNPDSIRAWIHDADDSDHSCYRIDFEPFRSESTPTKRESLSGVKALFR
jgi:hypothetical protein